MDASSTSDFLVKRDNLSEVRWAPAQTRSDETLADGEVLLGIDRYAFTANNITYGLVGDLAQYWAFFPAEQGWGRLPVWGHADVVASRVQGLSEGQRIFGYLPMSPYLKVRPDHVGESGFRDATPHRQPLPAVYQQYAKTRHGDPHEDLRALLQPLFLTGWLIDDWLVENKLFGARQVLLGSASSKTALSTAFALSRHAARSFEVVGLTSARNRDFCQRTGYYDRVVAYDELKTLPAETPSVFVDMSGSAEVRRDVHQHFRDALRFSSSVGMSHGTLAAPEPLPGPASEFFFAPAHIEQRIAQLGAAELNKRQSQSISAFFGSALTWLEATRVQGAAEIEALYQRTLAGQVPPSQGSIVSLRSER
ncbi:MAG: DUF2855 family protein [Polyangiales bacterium]